jgi:hypothetical protein
MLYTTLDYGSVHEENGWCLWCLWQVRRVVFDAVANISPGGGLVLGVARDPSEVEGRHWHVLDIGCPVLDVLFPMSHIQIVDTESQSTKTMGC